MAFQACATMAEAVRQARGLGEDVRRWEKSEHLARMKASSQFRYVREIVLHSISAGNAEHLVGLALSQAHIAEPLRAGATEDEIGITALRAVAARTLGDELRPWYWGYRVRIGIK